MIFACWNSGKTVDNKMRSHCGKRLFFVHDILLENFSLKQVIWVDVAQVKNLTNFQKTR